MQHLNIEEGGDSMFQEMPLTILTGNTHPELARSVAEYLDVPLGAAEVFEFSNENIFVRIMENVRHHDVFIVQPTCAPVNTGIMELLIMMDAVKRASAGRITAVIPYYGYARTDKKDQPRVPITARLIADLLQTAGANRLLTMDLHAGQIQGFFNIPTDNLYALPVFHRAFQERRESAERLLVVSPDIGGVLRARALANRLGADLAVIDKRRERAGVSEVMRIIGEPEGKRCLLMDDIIDSAGTICNAARALTDAGAASVSAWASHGVLSGPAVARITDSPLEDVELTDSVLLPHAAFASDKIHQVSVAPLLAEAIRRIAEDRSVSGLFE